MRSRRLTPYAVALSLLAGLFASTVPPAGANAAERVKGSYIVQLRRGVSPPAIAREYGGRAAFDYAAFRSFAFSGPDAAAARLARDPRVAAVSADYVVHTADTPPLPQANHLNVTDSIAAAGYGYDGNTATQRALIAIVDTGVDRGHRFFTSHSNVISAGDGHCVGAANGADRNGHGTATASNAAGRVGSAHEAGILPVRVFPGTGTSTTWARVICGLNYVKNYNTGKSEADDVDVVNMSIAGPGAAALRTAVENLIASGVVVVAAAGNDNGGAVQAPARYPGVISVSALTHYGQTFAPYSARNALMAAPGTKIFGADDGGRVSYRTGTSRSSPQVAGAVGVLLAIDPTLTSSEILDELRMSGRCPDDNQRGPTPCPTPWPGGGTSKEPLLDTYCAAAGIDLVNTDGAKCPLTP